MSFALRRRLSIAAVFSVVAVFAGLLSPMTALGAGRSGPAPIDGLVSNAAGRTSALVHVAQGSNFQQGIRAAQASGLEIGTHYEIVKVFVAYGTAAQFRLLTRNSVIEYVEANRLLEVFTATSHKATRGQNLLDGEFTLPDGTVIDGRGVGVAVVDSGVDGSHPDLADRMGGNVKIVCVGHTASVGVGALNGWQECRGPKEAVPMEDTDHPSAGGHGTHVAGTVGGTGAASGGKWHGAAPGATLYGVSIGTAVAVENAMDGLAWVLANHDQVAPRIKVANNSWGGGYRKYTAEGDLLYDALWKLQDALIAEGVTVVFAAGNSGGNGSSATTSAQCVNPRPGLICVANYDDKGEGTRAGTINSSSSRGKTDDPTSWPDLSAPGTSIVATCRLTLPVCNAHAGMVMDPPNLYSSISGTSMAAPHVAGIIAQLYQANPALTPAEVENILEDTAHKFAWGSAYGLLTDPFNPDDTSSFEKGHGLVDALAAVQAALGGGTTDPDPTPTTTATPTPTPDPTDTATAPPPVGTGKTYYFHSPTGLGNADWPAFDNPFDDKAPTSQGYSEWHDFPHIRNGPTGQGPYDPNWVGTVEGSISSITVDFWAKTPVGDLLREVHYDPTISVGGVQYDLPRIEQAVSPTVGNAPTRITKTYTTMLDSLDREVPLAIDPAGAPITFTIASSYVVDEAGSWIVYDSVEYPSGFTINGGGSGGTDPDPTPTETPTEEPTEPSAPTGRGTYPTDPNDPLFADQWGMTKIQAPQAWQETNATGYGVKIAIVDSGTDLGHEDFACPGKLEVLPGSDVADGDSNPQDDDGHGTHTSGIAGACTNNGKGVVGVAPDSTIMPVRTIGGDGDLDQAMADGIRFATDNGAHVINLSIGDIPPFSHMGAEGYPKTEDAMEHARNAGVVIAAAAGNFAQPTCEYPSLSRNVICVVATDRNDVRTWYTDFPVNVDPNGSGPSAERPFEPVVAAPGGQGTFCDEGIVSTYLRSEGSTCYTEGYDSLDGTSMSAPHVAGLAALLYDRIGGQRSAANADLIVNTILETSDDLYTPGWDPMVGYGRINALAAVTSLPEPPPTEPQISDTEVAFTENTSEAVQYTDNGTLEAQLTDSATGLPIERAELVFELVGEAGTREFRATTDATGTASETFTAVEEPGAFTLNVRYAGEEERYNGSADTRPFVIEKEDSSTALRVQGKPGNKVLIATLTESDAGTPLEGRVIEFFMNGASLGTATTAADGTASLQVPRRESSREQDYEAVFGEDSFYLGSRGSVRG